MTGSSTLNFSPSGLPTLVPALFNPPTNHVKSAVSDLQLRICSNMAHLIFLLWSNFLHSQQHLPKVSKCPRPVILL